jgi:alpha-amylase/alpha-mannosidase (GH57 family)
MGWGGWDRATMNRYLCIHGHFYQPPRENPWLEAVEIQDSAAPYHDWNRRVLAECYAPNAVSRILDEREYIRKIVNNYAGISFDFGPTLLSWLEENAGDIYRAVLAADQESQRRFSGHGSAIAQAYNHAILPLCNQRDKITQVEWGLKDFEIRFGRKAEGMWLPETAVDLETLDVLAGCGILFTILAPHQAIRVRPADRAEWQETPNETVDTTRAYAVDLPSGKTIAVFFYRDDIARAVSFEGLLSSGEAFARRLTEAFQAGNADPQLVHIATDGESYGHHHRFGDMALAYALDRVERDGRAELINYGAFLERFPPRWKAEIAPETSWSCSHGIERWRSDCGCQTGEHPDWRQVWRGPLREAFNFLRDSIAPLYEREAARYLRDPWEARNGYITVVLDRSEDSVDAFFRAHQSHALGEDERIRALKLLEMQRHAMLMFTSCGWYFDDLEGIETLQNLQYAARTVQLAQDLFGDGIEQAFTEILTKARGNRKGKPDGSMVYAQARAARVDLRQVAAHYAVSSIFESYGDRARISCYTVERHGQRIFESGRAKLAVGNLTVWSDITCENARLCYGMLHFGDHNFTTGVGPYSNEREYATLASDISTPFLRGDFPETIRRIDSRFGGVTYSLKDLFLDEQRKILKLVIRENLAEAEAVLSQLFEDHAPLMRFLGTLKMPLPKAYHAAAAVALNGRLRAAMAASPPDAGRIRSLFEQAESAEVELEGEALGFVLSAVLDSLAENWRSRPEDLSRLRALRETVELARSLPFWVDVWKAQTIFYRMSEDISHGVPVGANRKSKRDSEWMQEFRTLGELLKVRTSHEKPGADPQ